MRAVETVNLMVHCWEWYLVALMVVYRVEWLVLHWVGLSAVLMEDPLVDWMVELRVD